MGKIYELRNGDLTILVENTWGSNGDFRFKGLKLNSKPGIIFKDYISSVFEEFPDSKLVALPNYVYNKLKEIADDQLRAEIAMNINDQSFYSKQDEHDRYNFFEYMHEFKPTRPKIDERFHVSYSEVAEGILNCDIQGYTCIFDIKADQFIKVGDEKKPPKPMDMFYGGKRKLILAIEQYKKGIAHPAFAEIVELNKFLEGKKTVKFVMKDGTVHELKPKTSSLNANYILDFHLYNGKFYLENSYYLKPRLSDKTPVSELDYLQYGREKHYINADHLVLEQQVSQVS